MENTHLFKDEHQKTKVSKLMSYMLRHNPDEFGITLDENGFVDIEVVLAALQKAHSWVTREHVEEINQTSPKKRFEITGDRIRARYGHSKPVKPVADEIKPPDILYHGTSPKVIEKIKQEGLLPMSRQFVHMCTDLETAIQVGRRHHGNPVILRIRTKEACIHGVHFRKEGEVYLAEQVPPDFIEFPENTV